MPKVVDIPTISILDGFKARSIAAEKSYDSPGHFQEYIFGHKLAPFHWEIHEILLDAKKKLSAENPNPTLILAPRDHAKSTIGEAFALWTVGKNPLELVQFVCSVLTLAEKRLGKIEDCIKYNEKFRELFGNLYPGNNTEYTWNSKELEVVRDKTKVWTDGQAERDATFAAFGIDTTVEGGRATLQIYDDIVSRSNSSSPIQRGTVREAYWMSFDPMLLPTGQQVLFGTRYHYEDLYSELIQAFDIDAMYTDLYVVQEDGSVKEE